MTFVIVGVGCGQSSDNAADIVINKNTVYGTGYLVVDLSALAGQYGEATVSVLGTNDVLGQLKITGPFSNKSIFSTLIRKEDCLQRIDSARIDSFVVRDAKELVRPIDQRKLAREDPPYDEVNPRDLFVVEYPPGQGHFGIASASGSDGKVVGEVFRISSPFESFVGFFLSSEGVRINDIETFESVEFSLCDVELMP